jgi:hypothetical protein
MQRTLSTEHVFYIGIEQAFAQNVLPDDAGGAE